MGEIERNLASNRFNGLQEAKCETTSSKLAEGLMGIIIKNIYLFRICEPDLCLNLRILIFCLCLGHWDLGLCKNDIGRKSSSGGGGVLYAAVGN